MSIKFRVSSLNDIPFLKQILYEAAYWRGLEQPTLEKGLSTPELSKLLANWGRDGDIAIIAEMESTQIGAAWYRFWNDENHSYGYVSSQVPELAIGVLDLHRGKGVGRKLLECLLEEASVRGHNRLSLSVERDNPALKLYESVGFKRIGTLENAYTMIIDTNGAYKNCRQITPK
jgi:ribosomal protein S18 acetylase RimI-like enzyme